jgi:hypothetical protein
LGVSFPSRASMLQRKHPAETPIQRTFREITGGNQEWQGEEWIKTLEDGRRVKFTYQELPLDGAFITAQIEGNQVVYSIILAKAQNPLSRAEVERHFEGELSKK